MSIEITTKAFEITVPNTPDMLRILKQTGIETLFEWKFGFQGAGDASSGSVWSVADFGAINNKAFYYITAIFAYNDNLDTDFAIETHTDRWDSLHITGLTDEQITLFCGSGSYLSYDQRDMLEKPLELGQPRSQDADDGTITCRFRTNTENKLYNAILRGFATKARIPRISNNIAIL